MFIKLTTTLFAVYNDCDGVYAISMFTTLFFTQKISFGIPISFWSCTYVLFIHLYVFERKKISPFACMCTGLVECVPEVENSPFTCGFTIYLVLFATNYMGWQNKNNGCIQNTLRYASILKGA